MSSNAFSCEHCGSGFQRKSLRARFCSVACSAAHVARPSLDPDLRFRLKVYQRGDCWEWRGSRTPKGYGPFYLVNGIATFAHRHAYEMVKGSLGPEMQIDHLCRHPWCVRPSHLEAVTRATNLARRTKTAA